MRCGKYGRSRQAIGENITWRIRYTCRITNATDTNLEYEYLLLYHGNNGYANAPQCNVIRTLHVLVSVFYNQLTTLSLTSLLPTIKIQKLKVQPSLSALWRHVEGAALYLHLFLTSAIIEVNGKHHAPAVSPPGMHRVNYWIRCCICSRANRDVAKKETFLLLLVFETRIVQPADWSLYWLSYSDSQVANSSSYSAFLTL
jgi:hypothetical protein